VKESARAGKLRSFTTQGTAAERVRSPAVLIRDVRPDEYARAGQIVVAAYAALPGEHLTGGYAAELADVVHRSIDAEVLVAIDEELIGCVTFVPDSSSPWAEALGPGEAAIRMLGVDPRAQGRGVGGSLVEACIGQARQLGRSGLFLHSTPWMTAAHRIYERAGFRRVPDRDWLPVPEVPLLAFLLDLEGSPGAVQAPSPKLRT
jgi:ribosomal protein S18 acetylase RimI-like enzyme